MKTTSHVGQHLGPGFHQIHTTRDVVHQVWFMGCLISETTEVVNEVHGVQVPDPGLDGPLDDENSWPLRGTFSFADRTWTVVRDDDIGFWGFDHEGCPFPKQEFLQVLQLKNDRGIMQGMINGWWDVDPETIQPRAKAQQISIQDMIRDNKTLMAHLMVDLGFFPSVGQARKNGWDKPLVLGRHELGPRKKRAIVELIP